MPASPRTRSNTTAAEADARLVSYYTHGRDQALRATTHSVAAYVLSAA
jgi:hypothetical protein